MDESPMTSMKRPLIAEPDNRNERKTDETRAEDKDLTSALEHLNTQIQTNFFPSTIETPFPPSRVCLTSDSSRYLLISPHGKLCYLSQTDHEEPFMIDISGITDKEIFHASLINDEEIVIAKAQNSFYRINLSTVSLMFQGSISCFLRAIKVIEGTLYVLDGSSLRAYDLRDNSYKEWNFFEEESSDAMAIKAEGDEIVAAVATKAPNVIIYDLNRNTEVSTITVDGSCNEIIATKNFLAYSFVSGTTIWKWGSWEVFKMIRSEVGSITTIDINESESLFVAGLQNGIISVWDLSSPNLLPRTFRGLSGSIEQAEFKSNRSIFAHSKNDTKLCLLDVEDFPLRFSKSMETCEVKSIHYLEKLKRLLLNIKNKGLAAYDSESLEFIVENREEKDMLVSFSDDQSFMIRSYNDYEIRAINGATINPHSLQVIEEIKTPISTYNEWLRNQITRKGYPQFLSTLADGSFYILTNDLVLVSGFYIHECLPTAIASFNTGTAIISGDIQGNVLLYSLVKHENQGFFKKHAGSISAIEISKDDSIVVCASRDGVIRVSDIPTRTCIATLKDLNSQFTNLYLTQNKKYLLGTCEENYFCVWDFQTRTMIAKKDGYNNFLVYKNETRLCLVSDCEILVTENPLTSEKLNVLGNSRDNLDFFSYVRSFLNSEIPRHKPEFDNYLITPFFLNALHFFTIFCYAKALKKALGADSFLVRSATGHTPLSICVENKSSLMNDLIEHLIDKIEKNKGLSIFFEDLLIEINSLGSVHLQRLYNTLFAQLKFKHLPDFCSSSVELPISKTTENTYQLQVGEFFDKNLLAVEKRIEFQQFMVKLNLKTGSKQGIEFLESLVDSPNEEIFRTPFILLLLDKKWKKIGWISTTQGLLYYVYLILLIVYIAYVNNNLCLSILLAISSIQTLYEIFQMLTMKLEYFKSVINYIDILRAISFTMYSVMSFIGRTNEFMDILIVIVVLLSFLRGITFFSIFGPTRYMAYLIGQVFKDMLSFGIVLFYSIVSIGVAYMSLKSEKGDIDVFEMVLSSYTLSLGDFQLDGFNLFEKVIFIAATVLNNIVMLNLLISILGDTYGRVQEDIVQTDKKQIAQMIIEAEKLFIWKRSSGRKLHFSTCMELGQFQTEEDPWELRINALIDRIYETKKYVQEENQSTKDFIREENERIKNFVIEQNELTKDILLKEMRELIGRNSQPN